MKVLIRFDSESVNQQWLASMINACVDGDAMIEVLEIEPETSMETEIRDYLNASALARYSE